MGKAKKGQKYGQPVPEKVPLDEQIASGRVSKTKEKYKIRLRAEEEGVRILIYFYKNIFKLLLFFFFSMLMQNQQKKF